MKPSSSAKYIICLPTYGRGKGKRDQGMTETKNYQIRPKIECDDRGDDEMS